MQYIQTSNESYLNTLIGNLDEAYISNELELEFDYDTFGEYLREEDNYSMLKYLTQLDDLHKLDKKSK